MPLKFHFPRYLHIHIVGQESFYDFPVKLTKNIRKTDEMGEAGKAGIRESR
jgi:hypothetical protein